MRNVSVMTVTLNRLAASFADRMFERGDGLLLWRRGAGHVENFFFQNCSVEIVYAITERDLREGQSEADPVRREVIDIIKINPAHSEITQLFECGGALDIGKNPVGLPWLKRKRNEACETAGLVLQLSQLA